MVKKKTVGAEAYERLLKTPETRDPIEIQREVQKDYIANLEWAVRHMQKKVDCSHLIGTGRGHDECVQRVGYDGSFYVVVLTKKERLMDNVLRNYFFSTMYCPTPDFNQSVYKYHHDREQLEYLWTLPDEEVCKAFIANTNYVVPEEREMLSYILQFYDGSLIKKARQLNGENLETGIILEKK